MQTDIINLPQETIKKRYDEFASKILDPYFSNFTEKKKQNLFLAALRYQSVELLEQMIKRGFNPIFYDEKNYGSIVHIIASRNLYLVDQIIKTSQEHNIDLNIDQTNFHEDLRLSPLMYAILLSDDLNDSKMKSECIDYAIDITKLLLIKCRANPNVLDKVNKTAVHYALEMDLPYMIELLIVFGANPNIPDDQGYTPLDIAKQREFKESEEILKRFEEGKFTKDFVSARKEQIELAFEHKLSEARARHNHFQDSVAFVSSIKEVGIPADLKEKLDSEKLNNPKIQKIAVRKEAAESATVLEDTVIDYQQVRQNAMQTLEQEFVGNKEFSKSRATIKNNLRNAENLLIRNEDKVQNLSEQGYSVLHFAAAANDEEMTKRLIDRGDDVNLRSKDNNKYSVLDIAVLKKASGSVKEILQFGNPNFETAKTALGICAKTRNLQCFGMILRSAVFSENYSTLEKKEEFFSSLVREYKKSFPNGKKLDNDLGKIIEEFRKEKSSENSNGKKKQKKAAKQNGDSRANQIDESQKQNVIPESLELDVQSTILSTQENGIFVQKQDENQVFELMELNPKAVPFQPQIVEKIVEIEDYKKTDYQAEVPQFPYPDFEEAYLKLEAEAQKSSSPKNIAKVLEVDSLVSKFSSKIIIGRF